MTSCVVEANPAAVRLLGPSTKRVVGRTFIDFFEAANAGAAQGMISTIRSTGKADPIQVKLAGKSQAFALSASLFRQETATYLLIRLIARDTQVSADQSQTANYLTKLVETMPDAFVVTGLDRRILSVNSAFIEITQLASPQQAHGELLDRWLGRSTVDLNTLVNNLREHGSVRHFTTIVRGDVLALARAILKMPEVNGGVAAVDRAFAILGAFGERDHSCRI